MGAKVGGGGSLPRSWWKSWPCSSEVGQLPGSRAPLLATWSVVLGWQGQAVHRGCCAASAAFFDNVVPRVFHTTLCLAGRTRPLQVCPEGSKSPKMSH